MPTLEGIWSLTIYNSNLFQRSISAVFDLRQRCCLVEHSSLSTRLYPHIHTRFISLH